MAVLKMIRMSAAFVHDWLKAYACSFKKIDLCDLEVHNNLSYPESQSK